MNMAFTPPASPVYVSGVDLIDATFESRTEQIDVTTATKSKPDPQWFVIDARGHFHTFTDGGSLPTLDAESVQKPCSCVEECEGVWETVYRCAICGEQVEPRWITVSSTVREFVPGRTETWLMVKAYDFKPILGDVLSFRVGHGAAYTFGLARVSTRVGARTALGDPLVWAARLDVTEMGKHTGILRGLAAVTS